MGLKSFVPDFIAIAFQLSIVITMFAYGLRATLDDALSLRDRRRLLGRSLIVSFAALPIAAIAIDLTFPMADDMRIAIVALSLSAVPPVVPLQELKAGGNRSYAMGLTIVCATLSFVLTPLLAILLAHVMGRPFARGALRIEAAVLGLLLAPLGLGMLIQRTAPAIAERLGAHVVRMANVVLGAAILFVLFGATDLVRHLMHAGTIFGALAFAVAALVVGHFMGGPEPSESLVLAMSNANRHPGLAFAITTAAVSGPDLGAAVLLALVVSEMASRPYLLWAARPNVGSLAESPLRANRRERYSLRAKFHPASKEPHMKPLDQQLSDLSVRAKKAEDAIAEARRETRDRVAARREEFRAAAAAAADRVDQDLKSAGATLEQQWNALREKVTSDINRLRTNIAERQVERNVHRLADRASRKENEACVAIDFALASIEDAKLAVLDAVIAKREADDATSGGAQ